MQIKRAKICFISSNHVSVMKRSAHLSLRNSMSFLLSLAEYLQAHIKLKPPNLKDYLACKQKSQLDIHIFKPYCCDYLQAWNDYLFELISKGKVLRANEDILFVASVSEEYFKDNLSNNIHFTTEELIKKDEVDVCTTLKESIRHEKLTKMPKNGKKIAIINFSTSVANIDKLKPKIHLQGLYVGQLYKFGDDWQSYRIINNHIPTVQQINRHDALLLTGSSYSVTSMCPQMKKFGGNLLKALSLNKRLKIVGTCFGHQFMGYLHGASVCKRNFVKGPQKVKFHSSIESIQAPFLGKILRQEKRIFQLYQYHNDHVCSIPKGFVQIGESETCSIESMISEDRRIWTCQFHPQYTAEYIQSYELRTAKYHNSELHEQKKEAGKDHHVSHQILRKAVRQFIDWIP